MLLEGTKPVLFGEAPGEVVTLLMDFFCDGIEPAGVRPAAGAAVVGDRAGLASNGLSPRELEVGELAEVEPSAGPKYPVGT